MDIEQSGPKSIGDGLLGNIRSMRCRENIHDRTFYRSDRHSLMLADLLRREVGPMNHDPFGVLPPQPSRHRNSEVNTRWVHVRDAVEQQGRFMRQGDALRSLTCLCLQDCFAVLGKPVCRTKCGYCCRRMQRTNRSCQRVRRLKLRDVHFEPSDIQWLT
jgi:hypothetical protein